MAMIWTPVRSSNVAQVGWDDETDTLAIEFTSGAVYEYDGQSEATVQDILTSSSPGSYVARYLRSLPARRVG